jgi:formylglycine-generating enzyme required for sulfatase activity
MLSEVAVAPVAPTEPAPTKITPHQTHQTTSPQKPKDNTHLQSFDFEIVIVNAKGEIIQREQKQAQYEIEDLGDGVTLEMVSIPGGTFMMGSPETEKQREILEKRC